MKRLCIAFCGVALAVGLVPAVGWGASPPVFVPGGWNSNPWDPNSNMMTNNFDGTYSVTIGGQTPGARYEFKLVEDTDFDGGDWGPDPNRPGPGNSWAYADGSGNVSITYDRNQVFDGWLTEEYRIGGPAANMDPGAWTFVGDFQSELGGSDWDNGYAGSSMSFIGGGIYQWTGSLPAGSYNGKAVRTGSWDAIGKDNRSVNADNFPFSVGGASDIVTFRVDSLRGVAQVTVESIPEPASLGLLGFVALAAAFAARRGR